jgi:prevent-host-death family protein
MPPFIELSDARADFAALVDRAAAGEEIVIAKNGVPCARLVPIASRGQRRTSANAMRVEYVATDFDAADPRIARLFGDDTA